MLSKTINVYYSLSVLLPPLKIHFPWSSDIKTVFVIVKNYNVDFICMSSFLSHLPDNELITNSSHDDKQLIKSYTDGSFDCLNWIKLFSVSDCNMNEDRNVTLPVQTQPEGFHFSEMLQDLKWKPQPHRPRLVLTEAALVIMKMQQTHQTEMKIRVKLTSQQGSREQCKCVCVHSVCVCLL